MTTQIYRFVFPLTVFLSSAIVFAMTQVVFRVGGMVSPTYTLIWQYVVFGIILLGAFAALVRRSSSRMIWEVALSIASVAAVWYACALLFPLGWAVMVAAILTVLAVRFQPAFLFFTVIGIAGLAFVFAARFVPEVLIGGLAALVIYDIVAASHGQEIGEKNFIPRVLIRPHSSIGVADVALPLAVALSLFPLGNWAALVALAAIMIGAVIATARQRAHRETIAVCAIIPAILILFLQRFV
jgi:hypothetical protein